MQSRAKTAMTPAIVVPAFNRPSCLARILKMIGQAKYPKELQVPLVISIDGGGPSTVADVAESFEWKFGEKRIIKWPGNIGLKKHILACGALTNEFGYVIVLEDDLLVSPAFYKYALQCIESRKLEQENVAGASLYSYRINETTRIRFDPVFDGYDNYYLQVPSSWGQLWGRHLWEDFEGWLSVNDGKDFTSIMRNAGVLRWGTEKDTSWKKYFAAYMLEKGKFMLFPRASLTDNPGERGVHHSGGSFCYRTSLATDWPARSSFSGFDESLAIYDQNFELSEVLVKRMYPNLKNIDFCVFLNESTPNEAAMPDNCIMFHEGGESVEGWGDDYHPPELNIIFRNSGNKIGIYHRRLAEDRGMRFRHIDQSNKFFTLRDGIRFVWRHLAARVKKKLKRPEHSGA